MIQVMHEKTVCRCGWTPTSQDRDTAREEVDAHRAQHMDGTLPFYDTYPEMPPLPPSEVEQLRAKLATVTAERDSANARFCDEHRGVWKAASCVACSVITGGETELQQRLRIKHLEAERGAAYRQGIEAAIAETLEPKNHTVNDIQRALERLRDTAGRT